MVTTTTCRSCGHGPLTPILSLGVTPLADALLTEEQLTEPEITAPLDWAYCPHCALLQITESVDPEILFGRDYPYYSSVSRSLLAHFRASAEELITRRDLNASSQVVEAASNDGYMLKVFAEAGIPVLGIDPADGPARAAQQAPSGGNVQPQQYLDIQTKATSVADGLEDAATTLQGELSAVLGHGWQGQFAENAQYSVRGLVQSAHSLSGALRQVADKAASAHNGFEATRTTIAEYAAQGQAATTRASMAGLVHGPADGGAAAASARAAAQRQAAEEQARAIVNTTYSPSVMDANLDDIDFTSAYRVVSGAALGGPSGIDMARIWNTDDLPRPAPAAAPNADAVAAYAGTAPGGTGGAAAGGGAGTGANGAGVAGAAGAMPTVDAATEQALLASRGDSGAAALAGSGGAAGTGGAGAGGAGGVNAATTAAGAPFAPIATGHGAGGGAGTGAAGARGGRGTNGGRDRSQGFGNAAGLIGGGGAAAAGAGAMRMGGAGTLAGLGSAAGPGPGGPIAGSPGLGAGSVPGAGAGTGGAGAVSSSSGGAAAGRAGGVPMGGMMGAANAGQNSDKRGHTPASYLVNATNTSAIIGEPLKVSPAVIGRRPDTIDGATETAGAAGATDAAAGTTSVTETAAATEQKNGARVIRGLRGIVGLG